MPRFQLYRIYTARLKKAGFGHVPVISLNLSGLEGNPGFKLTPSLIMRIVYGALFGDIFMKCVYHMRPYEAVPGTTDQIHRKWAKICKDFVSKGYPSRHKFKKLCRDIIHDLIRSKYWISKNPASGIVGEILVKFLPAANNHLVELLEAEGAEAVVPDLADFLQYCFYNQNFKVSHLGMKKSKALAGRLGVQAVEWFRSPAQKPSQKANIFHLLQKSNI